MTLELFPFRYREPLTGRWVKARYKATREDIAARHAEWEITGSAELRRPIGRAFSPYRVVSHSELRRLQEPAPQINPHLDRTSGINTAECFLVGLFLRRYVTYCARRRRYAQMQGAVRLHREVTNAMKASADAASRYPRPRSASCRE
jgi:hypothetical protein